METAGTKGYLAAKEKAAVAVLVIISPVQQNPSNGLALEGRYVYKLEGFEVRGHVVEAMEGPFTDIDTGGYLRDKGAVSIS